MASRSAYATDTEHFACVDSTLKEARGRADILIYDAQYTPEEYPSRLSVRGHSTWAAGAEARRVPPARPQPRCCLIMTRRATTPRSPRSRPMPRARCRARIPAAREGLVLNAKDAPLSGLPRVAEKAAAA